MEEILASIRRIIADDDAVKPPKAAEPPPPPPKPVAAVPARPAAPAAPPVPPRAPAPPPPAANKQEDIDAMLAQFDAPPPPPPPAAPDVLDLTEAMAQPVDAPAFRTIDGTADVVFTDRAPEPPPPPPPVMRAPEPPRMPAQPIYDQALISSDTAGAVDRAFNSLANTVLGNNARTLEDLVKEMLRPMLKGWLDDNLPGLVDRIVRSEIERVSRGGR